MTAAVAELADARDLKSRGGNIVSVRFRSAAHPEESEIRRKENRPFMRRFSFSFDYIFRRKMHEQALPANALSARISVYYFLRSKMHEQTKSANALSMILFRCLRMRLLACTIHA